MTSPSGFCPFKAASQTSENEGNREIGYWRSINQATSAAYPDAVTETVMNCEPESTKFESTSVGTDLSMKNIEDLLSENAALKHHDKEVEMKIKAHKESKIQQGSPVCDLQHDNKVKFYTGLPSASMFFTLLTYLTTAWTPTTSTVTPEKQLFAVLTKLRLGLTHQDLAYRFNSSCGTISAIFHDWLHVMSERLQCLICWPSREHVRKSLPDLFRTKLFKGVRCIIDCSEIFIQRPTSLSARALTYSQYKSHNTVKFLIGISPTGAVTFLSKAWGGRASNKVITQQSGLIDVLEQGNVVLADRGFNFPEYFATKGVRLLVPSTRGKTVLTGLEVSRSRQMSRARIHVERSIGKLKAFHILKNTLPISMIKHRTSDSMATINKILLVCAALSNLDKPLVC
ncbi:uncharacterized protein LOC125905337 [Epinephelus fuscoguttatus]|uniref:uncharacterized protein LOC125905337 n=1 Tax=Epinephelus fuscoguttatus TaxID=293821 RepID=UPI0020D0BBF2|nr:uncharacterized protein LOC125905337 [Epinephelus fuscoguttatus]